MGNYASNAELKARFEDSTEVAELTDSSPTPDETVLTAIIAAAEGDLNSRLAKRYKTPVDVSVDTELAATLKYKTLDLAEIYLLRRGDHVSETKDKQDDKVLEWAEMIAKGEWVLPGAVTPISTTSRDPVSQWSGSNRTLSDSSPRVVSRETMSKL